MTKTSIAATAIALGLMASAGPASAYYYRYGYDPGAAIALGILGGALAGATIASQGIMGIMGIRQSTRPIQFTERVVVRSLFTIAGEILRGIARLVGDPMTDIIWHAPQRPASSSMSCAPNAWLGRNGQALSRLAVSSSRNPGVFCPHVGTPICRPGCVLPSYLDCSRPSGAT